MPRNKIILLGNLTRDPELSYTPSQTAVCKIGVAVNSGWGEHKHTLFMDCFCYGKKAEALNTHFHKGDPIDVEGELRREEWDDKQGHHHKSYRVYMTDWGFVPSKGQHEPQTETVEPTDDDIPF